ncbi:MAG: hypothetical protein EHM93_11660 [Bacteroidales bacterium]|nr:MAG: hypothetical protein EHM93_11660 [Bacteroidales bacterium]
MKRFFLILLIICALAPINRLLASSTSEDSLSFNLNADLVSRYLWRGLQFSPSSNIQPYASISYKGIEFGAWASYGLSVPFVETDLYLSYSMGQFTFTVNDYYTASDDSLENYDYLNLKKSETRHALEGSITYEGSESFPVSLTAATFFAGYDDNDGEGNIDYSTYFEFAYNANLSGIPLRLFVGGTPQKGLYSDNANIVNVGLNATKQLKISSSLEIPAFITLAVNPNSKDMFFVFGLTF